MIYPTATDLCNSVEITVVEAVEIGTLPGTRYIHRTLTITSTDGCGNEDSTTQTITVSDTTIVSSHSSQMTTQLNVLTSTQWMTLQLQTTVEM